MNEMLANRYLLNGDLKRAIDGYRRLLAECPDSESARCRLVLACLAEGRLEEAAGELNGMIRKAGLDALGCLENNSEPFLAQVMLSADTPMTKGLGLLLSGDLQRALFMLNNDNLAGFPAVTDLRRQLADLARGLNASTHNDDDAAESDRVNSLSNENRQ